MPIGSFPPLRARLKSLRSGFFVMNKYTHTNTKTPRALTSHASISHANAPLPHRQPGPRSSSPSVRPIKSNLAAASARLLNNTAHARELNLSLQDSLKKCRINPSLSSIHGECCCKNGRKHDPSPPPTHTHTHTRDSAKISLPRDMRLKNRQNSPGRSAHRP